MRYQPPHAIHSFATIEMNAQIIILKAEHCQMNILPLAIQQLIPFTCALFTALGPNTAYTVPVGDSKMESFITRCTFLFSFLGFMVLFIGRKPLKTFKKQ
jgi:hypothetical protein